MTDQRKLALGFFLFLFSINLILASTYCNRVSPTDIYYNTTDSVNPISMTCRNQIENTSVTISSTGSYLSISPQLPITIQNNSQTFILTPDSNAPAGNYQDFISFSDGSSPIQINLHVSEKPVQDSSGIIIFPTAKTVTVQQEQEKTQNIMLTVPQSYPRTITIQSVDFNPGTETIKFGDLNLGQVSPGNSIQIPIIFSGKLAQVGTYSTGLSIFAMDPVTGRVNLPQVSLTLYVTTGITPVTNSTFSAPPSCSLSATQLSINSTYSFTCSNADSNLEINIPSNDYYIGQKVDISGNLYKYEFKPIKSGTTTFKAEFKYKGGSVFNPFIQDIKISPASGNVGSTKLKFIFTPSIESATGNDPILIQLVDNSSGNLVSNPRILINALEVIPLNNSPQTFSYKFNTNADYELRGSSDGYDNLVQTIDISPKTIDIFVTPSTGDHNTIFNITTSVNSTLKINGNVVLNPYYATLVPGNNIIEASQSGYVTKLINISVSDYIHITDPVGLSELEKKQYTITLSKPVNWTIFYQKKLESGDKTIFSSGLGNQIIFTPNKAGFYSIQADNMNLATYELKGFSFTDNWWFMPVWGWLIVVVVIFLIIIFFAFRGGSSKSDDGLVMNVGD